MDKITRLFEQLYTIRSFETLLLDQFASGIFPGTTHTSLGQEANAVGVLAHCQQQDVVVSNHRCHGHFLAYGGDPTALFAELMGKPSGVCGGIGGSQHLHWRNFYSNGIQGGTVALAAGMALAEKHVNSGAIVFDFMGDGTLGEGIVYESLNMISLWLLPVLIVLEHNHIAQTTSSDLAIAGSITGRFEAFGIPATHLDTSNMIEIESIAGDLVRKVRSNSSPQALVVETARLGTHSKGDDTRDPYEVEQLWLRRDPIEIMERMFEEQQYKKIKAQVDNRIQAAFKTALAMEGREI
jgi:TPP-dependent pyruvate/acetoin dehydrogenase alpha subunit